LAGIFQVIPGLEIEGDFDPGRELVAAPMHRPAIDNFAAEQIPRHPQTGRREALLQNFLVGGNRAIAKALGLAKEARRFNVQHGRNDGDRPTAQTRPQNEGQTKGRKTSESIKCAEYARHG